MRKFPPERLAKYPHMFPRDIVVWERFLDRYGAAWQSFAYDVRVGTGEPVDPTLHPSIQKDMTDLTQRRIDVVGFRPDSVWIFEVKPRAGTSAPGQALAYERLYRRTYPASPKTFPAVVCASYDADVKTIAGDMGVILFVVS